MSGRKRPPAPKTPIRAGRPIGTEEYALAFSDLTTVGWLVVARRDRMESTWQYLWSRKDVTMWHRAKELGQAIAVQDQSGERLVVYGKLVG